MKDRFYYNWLFVNEEKDQYKDPLNITPLTTGEYEEQAESAAPDPGYSCLYGNRFRNGNCGLNFTLAKDNEYIINRVSDNEVIQLLLCEGRLLAGHPGLWALYDSSSKRTIKSGNWRGWGGTFFAQGGTFYIFDNVLQTIDSKGELLHNTAITLPPGIGINEIARIDDYTVISAYVSQDEFQDRMPKELKPCGFLEVIKEDSFTEPHGQLKMRDKEESSTIAFVEDNILYPIYLDEFIVQTITNGIVILDYEMIIQRVIESEFEPQLASCGLNSTIYIAVKKDHRDKLLGISLDGRQVFENDIPAALGRIASPPLVSSNGNVYWVGTAGYVVYNPSGEEIIVQRIVNESDADLYPVLYNENLVIGFGNKIVAYDTDGGILFSFSGIPGKVTTPLAADNNENYFIGTSAGLFSIMEK
ncbi:MAG: hypothetical protein GY841_21545 [FCB group bacterium]|nr:hypothetical protein [FCB group bacterium]